MFERSVRVGWAQVDPNGHMRNSAYIEAAVDVRMLYFAEHGLDPEALTRLGIGPVARKDEIEFFREVRMLDTLRITLALAAIAPDGSRWMLRQEIYRGDGVHSARLQTIGGFIDLASRKLVVPPPPLRAALDALQRTEDFTELRSAIRPSG